MNVYDRNPIPSANRLVKILGLVLCSAVLSACWFESSPPPQSGKNEPRPSEQKSETPDVRGKDGSPQQDEPGGEIRRDIEGRLSKQIKDIIPVVNAQIEGIISEINSTFKSELRAVHDRVQDGTIVISILGIFLLGFFLVLLIEISNQRKAIQKLVTVVDRLEKKIEAVRSRTKTISNDISGLSGPRSLVRPDPKLSEDKLASRQTNRVDHPSQHRESRPTEISAQEVRPTEKEATKAYNGSTDDETFQSRYAPTILKVENLDARRENPQIKPVFVEDQSGRYFVVHCIDGAFVFPKKDPVVSNAHRRSGALDEIYECQELRTSAEGNYKISSVILPAVFNKGFGGWNISMPGKLALDPYE